MCDDAIDPEGPLGRRDRVLALIAPALLLIIAAMGVYNFHADNQSSWQGASFGMFATYDNSATRSVRITISDDGGEETRIDARGAFDDLIARSRVEPFGPAPEALAEAIAQRTGAASVTIEIWSVTVDAGDDLVIQPRLLRRLKVT